MSADTGTATTTFAGDRRALATFLRDARGRMTPAPSAGRRRRTTGLRREEGALRAGISVTWYTWLEQGRAVTPSAATLHRLADALELTAVERAHLVALNGGERPTPALTRVADGTLLLFVETLSPHPAYAINGRWDVLAANSAAHRAFGRFDARPGITDNILTRLFLDPRWRDGWEGWERLVDGVVPQFRAANAAGLADGSLAAFVGALAERAPAFAERWAARRVLGPTSHEKSFRHPTRGRPRFHYTSVAPDDAPADVRVVIYRPADPRTTRALR